MTAYAAPAGGQYKQSKTAEVYQTATAITPADATKIGPFNALYIGVAGDVKVCMVNDDGTHLVVFKAVPVGLLRIAVQGVESNGTTATNILGLA